MKNYKVFKVIPLALVAVFCVSETLMAQEPPPEARATFFVAKGYDDFNPAPVEVTISCNTGLPLTQTTSIGPSTNPIDVDHVEFVVVDFNSGELDCEIFEQIPGGYQPLYVAVDENQVSQSTDLCLFENVEHGDEAELSIDPLFADNLCLIGNFPILSTVTVTKEWIDENPEFNPFNIGEATYSCTNLPDVDGEIVLFLDISRSGEGSGGPSQNGFLQFFGNPGVDSFQTFGNWDGGTHCTVTETFVEGGIESDDSDCDNIVLFPGDDAECTIVNTRLFEGIPTLSQYGLALLAMLMLGLGLVAYRRFI